MSVALFNPCQPCCKGGTAPVSTDPCGTFYPNPGDAPLTWTFTLSGITGTPTQQFGMATCTNCQVFDRTWSLYQAPPPSGPCYWSENAPQACTAFYAPYSQVALDFGTDTSGNPIVALLFSGADQSFSVQYWLPMNQFVPRGPNTLLLATNGTDAQGNTMCTGWPPTITITPTW